MNATRAIELGYNWYPNHDNFHDKYIFNPGITNLIILWKLWFGTERSLPYLFIVFNLIILLSGFDLCRRLRLGKSVRYLYAYMMIAMPSNTVILNLIWSEIPTVTCCMSACWLVTVALDSQGAARRNILLCGAGMLLGAGYWIRPLAICWLASAGIFLLMRKARIAAPATLCAAFGCVLVLVAIVTHRVFPDYNFSATTSSFNLLMSADESATGSYNNIPFKKGHRGFLECATDSSRPSGVVAPWDTTVHYFRTRADGFTYRQYDSAYRTISIAYIKEHPWDYVSQTPAKFSGMYMPNNAYIYPAEGAGFNRFQKKLYGVYWGYQSSVNRWLYIPVLCIFWLGFVPLLCWRRQSFMFIALPVLLVTMATLPFVGIFRYSFITLPWIYAGSAIAVTSAFQWLRARCHTELTPHTQQP
ncbi:MAG: hypothetical protein NC187_06025 [Candidatus Amulumruptor caecigallinarius]|nr:hypothetical protein [Candidatus Amulumruptor caecigallinarius]MCM1397027.1 hypothetical protein [Candidatus Amulumruptor caecigallinarius]MCM1454036.1 hypothetical protein [bacterium]